VITVGANAAEVERSLAGGELECPLCGGVLARWGHARRRALRSARGLVRVRPRRARCTGCGSTHVLLPAFALLRRADLAEVIGAALAAKALGSGVRPIAAAAGRAAGTVRGWLRRFGSRAEPVRVFFTGLLVETGTDPVVPAQGPSAFADAVAAVAGAAVAAASRWPGVGKVTPWRLASAASGGRLLSPGWPR
jgi:transposase-like protein